MSFRTWIPCVILISFITLNICTYEHFYSQSDHKYDPGGPHFQESQSVENPIREEREIKKRQNQFVPISRESDGEYFASELDEALDLEAANGYWESQTESARSRDVASILLHASSSQDSEDTSSIETEIRTRIKQMSEPESSQSGNRIYGNHPASTDSEIWNSGTSPESVPRDLPTGKVTTQMTSSSMTSSFSVTSSKPSSPSSAPSTMSPVSPVSPEPQFQSTAKTMMTTTSSNPILDHSSTTESKPTIKPTKPGTDNPVPNAPTTANPTQSTINESSTLSSSSFTPTPHSANQKTECPSTTQFGTTTPGLATTSEVPSPNSTTVLIKTTRGPITESPATIQQTSTSGKQTTTKTPGSATSTETGSSTGPKTATPETLYPTADPTSTTSVTTPGFSTSSWSTTQNSTNPVTETPETLYPTADPTSTTSGTTPGFSTSSWSTTQNSTNPVTETPISILPLTTGEMKSTTGFTTKTAYISTTTQTAANDTSTVAVETTKQQSTAESVTTRAATTELPVTTIAPKCVACIGGYFSNNSQCKVCPKLGYCPDPVYCDPCPPGQYCDSTPACYMCFKCLPGTFAPVAGSPNCKSCPPGTYADETNSTVCLGCPAGFYCPVPGNHPLKCPKDSVCPANSTYSTYCTPVFTRADHENYTCEKTTWYYVGIVAAVIVGSIVLALLIAVPAMKVTNSQWYRNRQRDKIVYEHSYKELDSIDADTVLITRDSGPVYDGS